MLLHSRRETYAPISAMMPTLIIARDSAGITCTIVFHILTKKKYCYQVLQVVIPLSDL